MLLGGADPIADPGRSRLVFERLGERSGHADKLLRVFDGMRHEVFHELGRERVVAALLAWLDARCPAPAA
jgi:alpha-beta hydrolase superfamily lysophospholipase